MATTVNQMSGASYSAPKTTAAPAPAAAAKPSTSTSLFQGAPQTATSYVTTTSETPKWMQDAIYTQIQMASNLASKPYQEYNAPRVAELSPLQQQAYKNVANNQGFWQSGIDAAQTDMYGYAGKGTSDQLNTAQDRYLNPSLVGSNLTAGQDYYNRAGQQDITGAAQPYLAQAGQQSITGAADPYLQTAAQSSAANINQYMSPYQQNVMDVMARQGARNLSENLLPGVSDAFIRAGQFGSGRMGEFGSRALRDTQEGILNQQAQLANQGYGQALSASQADLARQAQLASTAGQLTGQQQQNLTNLGQTAGQLTSQQQQNLANLGQMQTGAGQAQQQFGLSAAQAAQQAQAADYQRQMGALGSYAQMQQQEQAMRNTDVASLEAAGQAQQRQQQATLDAAYQQFVDKRDYPKQQADWLSTQVRGMAPITPTSQTQSGSTTGASYSPSPLSQLATAYYTGKALTSI